MSSTPNTCSDSTHYEQARARWKNAKEDNQFPMTTLAKTLQDYQDPAKCDKITQINSQLDETKDVLVIVADGGEA